MNNQPSGATTRTVAEFTTTHIGDSLRDSGSARSYNPGDGTPHRAQPGHRDARRWYWN